MVGRGRFGYYLPVGALGDGRGEPKDVDMTRAEIIAWTAEVDRREAAGEVPVPPVTAEQRKHLEKAKEVEEALSEHREHKRA